VSVRRDPLVRAVQVARETEVQESPNGVRFATFGETGVTGPDLDRMLGAVPAAIVSALGANTYYFVPLALREPGEAADAAEANAAPQRSQPEQAMVAYAWSDELGDAAICHRNVELGSGRRGVFISTRLMNDRFALSFEFFINVAHAFVETAGVPERFAELAWQQAVAEVRGETSLDAWESRNLAQGREPNAVREDAASSRQRRGGRTASVRLEAAQAGPAVVPVMDEKERGLFGEAAFSDAVAIYLLSLALDFDYSELREREYPLLEPAALAARLRMVAELFPPNPGYEFSVRYRRRA
jgi:hypothetical protein